MSHRVAGDVKIQEYREIKKASAQVTTSGGVTIMSVNTTGASEFAITNFGSINIFITGSFDSEFAMSSIGVVRAGAAGGAGGLTSVVEAISASTAATFNGIYQIVRVVANSGSGVYRANLTYR